MKKSLVVAALMKILLVVSSCALELTGEDVFLGTGEILSEENYELHDNRLQEMNIIKDSRIPYPFIENGLIGFKNEYGEIIIQAQYYDTSGFFDGLAFVIGQEGREYLTGYIDSEGNLVIPLPTAIGGSSFSEGFAFVTLREWDFNNEDERMHMYVLPGPLVFINKKGENVFSQEFLIAAPFSEGFASVRSLDRNVIFINSMGVNAFGMEFRSAGCFVDGYANVKLIDGTYTHIDREGNIVDIDRLWGQFNWIDGVMSPATYCNPPSWWTRED
ncbi:MAG: WG repeat-containing protein [Defluviitaleaceae bacterium]|nr:WG repeat-containing protein [Defluviitaleaceae bacterium]